MPISIEEQVVAVLARRSGLAKEKVKPDARLVQDLKLDGDDALDAVLEISEKCAMDVSGFDSSRYFRSEPTLLTLLPFLPSQRRDSETKQPLTVAELIEAARSGKLQ
jgi:hypothetical protein